MKPRREHESAARGSGGSVPTLPEDSPEAHLDEGLSQSAEHKQATVSSIHHEGRRAFAATLAVHNSGVRCEGDDATDAYVQEQEGQKEGEDQPLCRPLGLSQYGPAYLEPRSLLAGCQVRWAEYSHAGALWLARVGKAREAAGPAESALAEGGHATLAWTIWGTSCLLTSLLSSIQSIIQAVQRRARTAIASKKLNSLSCSRSTCWLW